MRRIRFSRLPAALVLCGLTVWMTAACQQQPQQPRVEYVTNAGWEAAVGDFKNGRADQDEGVQGCVLQDYHDLDRKTEELPVRRYIAERLDVSIGAAFKVFCNAFVQAVVEDRLVTADYNVFLGEAKAPQDGVTGRVSREVQATHRELMRIQAEKST